MIEDLKKKVADLEGKLRDAKDELKNEVMKEELSKLQKYLGLCCKVQSRYSVAYLINVNKIEPDDYDELCINIEADKAIIIDTDVPGVNLDEESVLFSPESDVIFEIKEDEIWNAIGKNIKELCLG